MAVRLSDLLSFCRHFIPISSCWWTVHVVMCYSKSPYPLLFIEADSVWHSRAVNNTTLSVHHCNVTGKWFSLNRCFLPLFESLIIAGKFPDMKCSICSVETLLLVWEGKVKSLILSNKRIDWGQQVLGIDCQLKKNIYLAISSQRIRLALLFIFELFHTCHEKTKTTMC